MSQKAQFITNYGEYALFLPAAAVSAGFASNASSLSRHL